ncbi:hypothetical protein [Dyella silvatica]|uniref:hypothetical protein n=1 Tax=Dyella silvatica TaxID=2992128 RepID=UPI002252B4F9|nr:hypothetical protein [Dyella silvatica]
MLIDHGHLHGHPKRAVNLWLMLLLAMTVTPALAQEPASTAKSNERTTGNGGRFIKYSSTQVAVDLTAQQQQDLEHMQSRRCVPSVASDLVNKSGAALKDLQFAPVTVNSEVGLIRAEHDEALVSTGRRVLRGVLASRLPLIPTRADHQTTQALVVVRPEDRGALVHLELTKTVWDNHGNAKTTMVTEPTNYQSFFDRLGQSYNCSLAVQTHSVTLP